MRATHVSSCVQIQTSQRFAAIGRNAFRPSRPHRAQRRTGRTPGDSMASPIAAGVPTRSIRRTRWVRCPRQAQSRRAGTRRARRAAVNHASRAPTGTTKAVVLGGGFAGIAVARGLARHARRAARNSRGDGARPRRADVQVTLVNRENYFVFQPLLTEILSGTIGATHVVVPLRRMLRGVDVEVAVVEAIDLDARQVMLRRRQTGDEIRIGYDHLVLALGSVTDFRTVPGM